MDGDLTFDPALREIVSPEIRHGEKLLWIGKPTPLRVVIQRHVDDLFSAVFVVFVMAISFSAFSSFGGRSFGTSGFLFWLLPLIFAAVGLYAVGRPLFMFWEATRTVYAVTDYRALILKPKFGGMSAASYPKLERVERTSFADGKGDLVFSSEAYRVSGRWGYRTRYRKIGFFGIPDVRRVEELLLENIPGSTRIGAG